MFRAAVLRKIKEPLSIENIKKNKLKTGQVLVEILYSGICRSQYMEINGFRGKDYWLPHLLGHEASGIVKEIGNNVKKVMPGDKVIITWINCSGIASKKPTYYSHTGKINSGLVSTFSNLSIISENKLIKKPRDMPMDIAALFGCAMLTGSGIVINQAKPKKNEIVGVLGLGGIGLSTLLTLKAIKHKKIIIIDNNISKKRIAKKIGNFNFLNSNSANFLKKLNNMTNNQGLDICIESAGSTKTIELGFDLINKNNGKLFFASHPIAGEKIRINPHDLISGKKIIGSWAGNSMPDNDIKKLHKLFKKYYPIISKLIKKKYSLNNINKALTDLSNNNSFRQIIDMKL